MNFTLSSPSSNLSTKDCSLPVAHGIALITTNALVGVLGTLGNLLVCVAVVTNPRLRRFPNYLLFSLAIADLMITMVCEPLVVTILAKRTFQNACARSVERVYYYISNFSASSSVAHLSAISIDRLLAVVCPLRHKSIMANTGWKAMLVVCWTLPVSFFIVDRFLQAPISIKAFINLAVFVLCYGIVFGSYALIVISLIKQRKRIGQMNASSPDVNSRREIRVAFTLAIVIVVFTACWFPLFVVFSAAGKPLVKLQGTAHMWIRTVALSNSAMNFLIYGSRIRNFSETYVEIFRKILRLARIRSS
ncbi:adenosine receptor A2a-like [Oculina patagonica]